MISEILATATTIDFDPLHYVSPDGTMPFVTLFAAVRQIFTWSIAFIYLSKITEDGFKLVMILNTAHGVNNAGVTAELKKMQP